ncbi:MAG: hypothetical protein AB1643_00850 [Patescibacteria group bacterium]
MSIYILIFLMLFSGSIMTIMISRHLVELRKSSSGETTETIILPKVSLKEISKEFLIKAKFFLQKRLIPVFYQCAEKIIFKIGIVVKKIEQFLLKIDNRIRGKYRIINSGSNGNGSKYWEDIIEFKNNLNGNNKDSSH